MFTLHALFLTTLLCNFPYKKDESPLFTKKMKIVRINLCYVILYPNNSASPSYIHRSKNNAHHFKFIVIDDFFNRTNNVYSN